MAYGDVTKIRAGACKIFFRYMKDGSLYGDLKEIGYTQGGVIVSPSADVRDVLVDQEGTNPVDKILQGDKITIKIPLVESDYNRIVFVWPTCVPHPGFGDDVEPSGVYGGYKSGTKLGDIKKGDYDNYVGIYAHPIELDDDDYSYDVAIYKAMPDPTVEVGITFSSDTERVYDVTFNGYSVDSRPNGKRLWSMGYQASGELFPE